MAAALNTTENSAQPAFGITKSSQTRVYSLSLALRFLAESTSICSVEVSLLDHAQQLQLSNGLLHLWLTSHTQER